MSTPNPLIPQGTFQAHATKGASNVRIAVVTIVAIHVVFFGGLLLQGCKRDTQMAGAAADTNITDTNLSLPPIESSSLFYSSSNQLPTENTAVTSTSAPVPQVTENLTPAFPSTTPPQVDTWRNTNLGPAGTGIQTDSALAGAKEYTIVRGDTFGKIAAANDTTVSALRRANPDVDPRRIRPGMKIQVPAPEPRQASVSTGGPGSNGIAGNGKVYVVKSGDTLTRVARNHGVTISQLRAANNLRTSGLRVGQKLKIPAPASTNSARSGSNGTL